jgi:hypothetical protein
MQWTPMPIQGSNSRHGSDDVALFCKISLGWIGYQRQRHTTFIATEGLKLAERGGKNAQKRAVVAVARKLAVLLHWLWVSGEVYEPLRNSQKAVRAAA